MHFGRNAAAHAGKTQRRIVSAWIGTAYAEADAPAAHAQWRKVADQLRPTVPRLATLMEIVARLVETTRSRVYAALAERPACQISLVRVRTGKGAPT